MDEYVKLRHRIPYYHIIIGDDYDLLDDDDILQTGDETANASCILSIDHYIGWASIHPDWDDVIGKTIGFICDETGDMDGNERIFRRKIEERIEGA